MFEQLVSFYRDGAGWPVAVDEDNQILSVRYSHEGTEWVFVGTVDENTRIVTLFSRAPEACPADRRAAMCQQLIRLNWGMTHGAWDLDLDDGEVRYRVVSDLAGNELSPSLVQNLTNYNLATMATYLPIIRAVIAGEPPRDP